MTSNPLFNHPFTNHTRYQSGENPTGEKGKGGLENHGAKGHAFDSLPAGTSITLLNVTGSGVVTHIWLTLKDADGPLSPNILRGLRIEAYWDGASTPAVSAPLGDFFGIGLGQTGVAYENDLFSSPNGRAFNSYVPMPFLKSARIVVINDTPNEITHCFFTVTYEQKPLDPSSTLYFHAVWRRETATELRRDFTLLPFVKGRGRYLGTNVSVITHPRYGDTWFGEGEVKMYLDGDDAFPTLVGTGLEDYIGTGWGMSKFTDRFQGALVADCTAGRFAFYRYHVPDAIWFHEDIRVTVQQIGGGIKSTLQKLVDEGADIQIVSADLTTRGHGFVKALSEGIALDDSRIPLDGWCNYFRSEDWAACTYFYLDKPENGLLPLASYEVRMLGVNAQATTSRGDGG